MSTGKISAQKFFAENGLFRKLAIKDEKTNLSRSYKTDTQEYAMACTRCHQEVRQRGNANFECRRCRYSVAPSIKDGEVVWDIKAPSTKLKKDRAKAAMEEPAYVLSADELDMGEPAKPLPVKQAVEDSEEEDDDVIVPMVIPKVVARSQRVIVKNKDGTDVVPKNKDGRDIVGFTIHRDVSKKTKKTVDEDEKKTVDEDTTAKPPSSNEMVAFLKKTAPQVSGMRIVEQKRAYTAEQERDIDEPIPAVRKRKPSENVEVEVTALPPLPTMPATPTPPLPSFPTAALPSLPAFPTTPLPAIPSVPLPVAPSMPLPVVPSMPLPAIPTAQSPCTSTVKEVTMKVVSLAPGQTYFCPVTSTLYMGAPA